VDSGGILLVVMAALGACLLLTVGFFAFHRFAGPTGSQAVPCCYRPQGEQAWRPGALRYDGDRLDHYGPGGLSMRPEHRWLRVRLDLGAARAAVEGECDVLPRGQSATTVACRYGDQVFELSMGQQHYTALRSWLESMPPGYNANVA
jgi:Protein of unknown function (DUF2550)